MRASKALRLYTHTHTHTHTHTSKFRDKRKIIVAVVSVAIVLLIMMAIVVIQLCTKKGIIKDTSVLDVESSGLVETKPKALDTSSWDLREVSVYTDPASGKKAPIPVGYVASQVTGETGIDTGLVIYEGTVPVTGTQVGVPGTEAWEASCNRNQWVWVPVPDVTRIYDTNTRKSKLYSITSTGRSTYNNSNYEPGVLIGNVYDNERYFSQYNLSGMTKKKLLYELETELDETIKSIEKYGGFYIGRYETGKVTNYNSYYYVKPVVQRMQGNNSINYVAWYDSYVSLRTLVSNENLKSNIIWGCLWDETLQWFRESGAKTDEEIYNSATWGNHKDSEGFTYYTNVAGSTGSKTQNSSTITPTGSTERNKANNIYDMAGNMYEWTLEGYGSNGRRYRGGNYIYSASSGSVGNRNNSNPYKHNYSIRCARVLLHKIEILLRQNPIL